MLTYKDAGVDVGKADRMLSGLCDTFKATYSGIELNTGNDFASITSIPSTYRNPAIVSSTDGVGTKLNLAIKMNQLDTIGQDLVAMCVNDLVTTGADPLYFLDYFATSNLSTDQAETVIKSIATACMDAHMSLIGGETAEMPGMYKDGDFDLAGFATGVVEKDLILSPYYTHPGNVIIGVQSSGFHSNGFSLINKILETENPTNDVMQMLLEPTRLYVDMVWKVRGLTVSAAHITGGGLFANIQRAVQTRFELHEGSWEKPDVYREFGIYHDLSDEVMYGTFNQGIGFALIVEEKNVEQVLSLIDYPAWIIGKLID